MLLLLSLIIPTLRDSNIIIDLYFVTDLFLHTIALFGYCYTMNHRRASTGGCNMIAVPPSHSSISMNSNNDYVGGEGGGHNLTNTNRNHDDSYLVSPDKNSGYQEECDNSDENPSDQIVTIITYDTRSRTSRRSSFSGPITRRRGSTGMGSNPPHHRTMTTIMMPSDPVDPTSNKRSPSEPHIDVTKPTMSEELQSPPAATLRASTIQTSRGINPDVVARMSMSVKKDHLPHQNNNELVHLIDDDDDDDDSEGQNSPQQQRRGYVGGGSTNHKGGGAGGIDVLYGLGAPTLHASNLASLSKSSSSSSRRSMERRGSNASSVHSRSSRASQRRRSSVERRKFQSKDPLAAVTIYDSNKHSSHHHNTKSDLSAYDTDDDHNLNDDDLMSSEDEGGGGHGNIPNTGNAGAVGTFGYESDAASEHSHTGSMSSSKRSKRRNSCIIPNGHDLAALNGSAMFNGSVVAVANRSHDHINLYTTDDDDNDEEDDPDSLFNRAKRRSESMDYTKPTMHPISGTANTNATTITEPTTTTPMGTKRLTTPNFNHMADQKNMEWSRMKEEDQPPPTKGIVHGPASHGTGMGPSPLSPATNVAGMVSPNNVSQSVPYGTNMSTTMAYTTTTTAPTALESWMTTSTSPLVTTHRSSPIMVSYAAPTEENLRANVKHMLRIDKFSGYNAIALSPTRQQNPKPNVVRTNHPHPMNHHLVDTDESARGGGGEWTGLDQDEDDESSYGANMYTDTMVANSSSEYDVYHQKARRRASLENTHYNIDAIYESKGIKVPNFKPADGCKNASDFVVRCFTARMRISGFTVLKHNRSRWSKAKNRIIYLLPDNQTLSWRECEDDTIKTTSGGGNGHGKNDTNYNNKNKHTPNDLKHDKDIGGDLLHPVRHGGVRGPKIDLSKCIEVRYACSIDPKNVKKRGTPVLRSRCKDELAGKSFSLIFANRTLDLTAFSNDQCKVLMEGFSALCFRLQLQKMESRNANNQNDPQNHSDSDKHASTIADDQCTNADVDDWASTMFGGSTTNTSHSNHLGGGSTPWGR